jgi:hypothetical protein
MPPTARILSATLAMAVLAATAWGAPKSPAARPEPSETDRAAASGQWFLDPDENPGAVEFSLRMSRGPDHQSWSSETLDRGSLEGLSSDDLRGSNVPVGFKVRRDAGTFFARGTVTRGKGAGTFDLVLDPAFARELERRGVGRPTEEEQIRLAIGNVSLGLLDDFRESHYATPDVALLVRCVDHGVNREFMRGLHDLGYRLDSVDQLVTARDHGVDPSFIRGMREAGYRDLEFRELLRARDHGADPRYVAWMRRMGFASLSLEELIEARDHGVDADYVKDLESAGYRGMPLERLVRARDHGVDGEYVSDLKQAGYRDLSLEDAIRARDHGVDAVFATRAQRRLGHLPTLDELIRYRDRGQLPD